MSDPTETPPPDNGSTRTIDPSTYDRIVSAKQGLEGKVGQLEERLAAAEERASTADTLAKQLEEANAKAARVEQQFGTYKSVSGALGTHDSDAIDAAVWQYNRLPEEGRPELGDWLGGMREDPSKAPAILRPFFGTSEDPAKQPPPKRRQPPAKDQADPAGAAVDDAALKAMREHAIKTGDWSRYRAHRKAMGLG